MKEAEKRNKADIEADIKFILPKWNKKTITKHIRTRRSTYWLVPRASSYVFAQLLFGQSDRNRLKDYFHHRRHLYTLQHKDTQSALQTETNRSQPHHSSTNRAAIYPHIV